MKEKSIISDLQQKIVLYEDMQAYRKLYELLNERLLWFVYSFVKSKEAAEEIVSDTFIKLWKMRDQLQSVGNLRVFLYVIARNLSLNYLTRQYRYTRISLDDMPFEAISSINPEEQYISSETTRKISEAVGKLPSQCKLIFQMVRENGLKYKEAAAILNISELTVRNQLAIASQKLAQSMHPHLRRLSVKHKQRSS
jgi:RNA polymerase sigma-70 factor (family 1)